MKNVTDLLGMLNMEIHIFICHSFTCLMMTQSFTISYLACSKKCSVSHNMGGLKNSKFEVE